MDIDTQINQDNFNQTVDNSLVSDQDEPEPEQPKKGKKGPKKSIKKTKASKKRPEMSSDSEQEEIEQDPDFEPVFDEPTASGSGQISSRLRRRNRSKSTKSSS